MIAGRMRVYISGVILISVIAWCWVLSSYAVTSWAVIIGLGVIAFALSSMTIELPFASSISMAYAPVFAALVYSGPVGAVVVGGITGLSFREIRERKPLLLMAGNVAQLSICAALAGVVFTAIGGEPLQSLDAAQSHLSVSMVASIVSTTVFFGVNLLLISVGISLKTGMRVGRVLRALQPTSYWVSLLVLTLLGLIVAYLLKIESWLGLILLVLPFMVARRTFRVYVELTEAYTSTVRSLVTAIEAKDPYTRGHSERVADYAHRLAERMGLPKNEVDLIERAALLHDVGKIGISLDTLVSPDKLNQDEVNAIREHPVLGSDLVADVEFLSDIVDIVRHHHERCDGAGYPDGLVGERISVPARILAVADAYDAMTSDRAYRPRMTETEAREELLRVAGSQLDGEMVRRFTDLLGHDQTEQVPA